MSDIQRTRPTVESNRRFTEWLSWAVIPSVKRRSVKLDTSHPSSAEDNNTSCFLQAGITLMSHLGLCYILTFRNLASYIWDGHKITF
jgi:hypothetical protein